MLATVVGPSPNGPQFCHIWYIRPGGVTPVDHESTQLSRLEAMVVESPKSLESPDVTPMASQPQTPAQPTQPTVVANVHWKCSLQSNTLCLSCKLNMCNSSRCVILVPRSSLPFLWIPNNICFGRITLAPHQRKSRFTCVLFACISGGYHSLPCNTLAIPPGKPLLGDRLPPPPTWETVAR